MLLPYTCRWYIPRVTASRDTSIILLCNIMQCVQCFAIINPFTASCENAMTVSVPGVPASCEKFPHSSQLNFWSTESILNQFSVFLKTLNALCVCLQYKHPRSMKRVIRLDKPVTLLLLFWSHKCDFGAEPMSRIIATPAVKGLMSSGYFYLNEPKQNLRSGVVVWAAFWNQWQAELKRFS
jgi:hypothetical protein